MDNLASVISVTLGGASTVIGAVVLLVKALAANSLQMQVLRRVYDWLEASGLLERLPDRLREDLQRVLAIDTSTEEKA